MGYSLKPILFFSTEITLKPHTATLAEHLGRNVSIREFCGEEPCYLEQVIETNEYVVTLKDGTFMTGPEVY